MISPRRSAIALVVVFAFAIFSPAMAATRPNVVFVLIDDFGWTDPGCFGSDLYRTPHVDRLAREGMKFDNAYSACTVCSPTRAAVMTGRYPAALKLTDWIPGHDRANANLRIPKWTQHLDTGSYTLAKALRDAGYATGHFGKWHLGEEERYWAENQGFDVNVGGWSKGSPSKTKVSDGYFSPYGNPRLADGPVGEHLDERVTREAIAYIEANRKKPFFVNLWFYGVHTPLQAPADKIAKYTALVEGAKNHRNPTYAAMVEKMDDCIGQLMAALQRLGLSENTVVVFTSDNGGLIGNRGDATLPPRVTSNVPLRTGKGDVCEGGVRVPLIVRFPNGVKPGTVSHVPVISPDFYPTLLALTDTPRRGQTFDGVNLAPLLAGKTDKLARDAIFWHYPHYHS